MKRAPISAYLGFALVYGLATGAAAQNSSSHQPGRQAVRADHSALPYEVHIAATTLKAGSTSISVGSDSWSAQGYDLRTLIAQVYNVDVRRIDLPEGFAADARYDVSLDLATDVSPETMQQVLEDAIEKRFSVTIQPESRPMEVYVLTAPNGPGAAMHRHSFAVQGGLKSLVSQGDEAEAGDDLQRITYMGKDCSGVSSGGISVSGGTMSEFRRTLEPDLDRVLLDETHLAGSYDFKIGNYGNQDELFKLLHDQLGLEVTRAERNVTVVAVRSAAAPAQNLLQAKL
jgi:uncharacterized protein (TIGR03435 family)